MVPAVVLVGWFRLTQWFLSPEVVPPEVAVVLQPHPPAADGRVVRSRSYHAPLEQRHTGHSRHGPTDFWQKCQEVVGLNL